MSLAIKYESVDDARMRLRNTVVLYKGEPVLITHIVNNDDKDGIFRVKFQTLPTSKMKEERFDPFDKDAEEKEQRKYISSKHFDIAPFRLGYVNGQKGTFYCSRLPNRIQKQGLCGENFRGVNNAGQAVPFANFLGAKETPAMVAGRYPSFDKAVSLLDKVSSIAFDRDFCLEKDEVFPELLYLYHKGKRVGYMSKDEVTLGAKFKCLKENLEELKVRVG